MPYRDPEKARAWRLKNKESLRVYQAQHFANNRSLYKSYNLKRYGLTLEDFDRILLRQEEKCAVCRDKMAPPCVDHDHVTGKVRGLLCHPCNKALGLMKDNAETLDRAAAYLRTQNLSES